ncbi:MAG: adenosylcobinamide-GDP ribazoletransferase [Lentihominibacter sp.]
MKYIRGFLMAWGNFCGIPCPYHKWHEDSRRAMLIMLPWIGFLIGIIVSGIWMGLEYMETSPILTGVLVVVLYFLCSGFMHLDGFMDVNDAVLSRRPSKEERQQILKSPDTGAMAVISLVLIMMVLAGSMTAVAGKDFPVTFAGFAERACLLALIFTISRTMAARAVLVQPKMGVSQYAGGDFDNISKGTRLQESVILFGMPAALIIVIFAVAYSFFTVCDAEVFIMVLILTTAAAYGTGGYARKNLGGMNGDIAGYMIVSGEVVGLMVAALAI